MARSLRIPDPAAVAITVSRAVKLNGGSPRAGTRLSGLRGDHHRHLGSDERAASPIFHANFNRVAGAITELDAAATMPR
jgi:hypothetical protein